MEDYLDLFEYIYSILVLGVSKVFNISNPIINLGVVYGYLRKSEEGVIEVSNQILREYIYNYMISRADNYKMSGYNLEDKKIFEVIV